MSFARLDAHGRRLAALDHLMAIAGVDEAVNMPSGSGAARADAMAVVSRMAHELATTPDVPDWLAAADAESLDADQRAAVVAKTRAYRIQNCLPGELVERHTAARLRSEQLWRELRPKGDWKGFLPAFSGIVAATREIAERTGVALGLAPYDALIELYDPGNRSALITPVFEDLKVFLRGFVPDALEAQARRRAARPMKPLVGPFPIPAQKAFGEAVMASLGFDFAHGRLDISHHPFCGGVPTDVRMTTRYREDDFLSSFMGIIHETGHGLYEQNLPKAWAHWPVGRAASLAVHESQSLFIEKQIGRAPAFWEFALPLARRHFPAALEGFDIEDILAHVQRVSPGLIRVDADEVTYPLHVILRYELEQELIAGRLAPADVPEAWDAKMRAYLGLSTLDDPANGPMQDVHWPAGTFGYFPTYTLGALMAAQQWAAIERTDRAALDAIRRGDFSGVNAWRRTHVWSRGSFRDAPDLMRDATGEALNARYFIDHLKRRYLA